MKGLAPLLEKLALRIGALTRCAPEPLYTLSPAKLVARYQLVMKEFGRE